MSSANKYPTHVYAVIVKRVVTAGELDLFCQLTHSWACRQRLHLQGLRMPKPGTVEGDQARDWVAQWIHRHTAAHPPGVFMTIPREYSRHRRRGTFTGRVTAPDGAALDHDLVAAGIATWA